MLFTHKTELLYLEHARVYQEDGRVLYAQHNERSPQRFNFPFRNAQVLALGTGTSITNRAARLLAEEGVVLVFTGGEGTPYVMTGNLDYHPNEYAQGFIRRWMAPGGQLEMAKQLLRLRFDFTAAQGPGHPVSESALEHYREKVEGASSVQVLLGVEGDEVKNTVYRSCSQHYLGDNTFRRSGAASRSEDHANINERLNQGNNLAYAMAAGALWHMGVPAFFPLIHGQTRNGGLIFDIADLIKDGVVAPWAFEMRDAQLTEAMGELRYRLKTRKADRYMIEAIRALSEGGQP